MARAVAVALDAGLDEVIVVAGAVDLASAGLGVPVLANPRWAEGIATSLQVAVQHAEAGGHDSVVVGLADQPLVGADAYRRLAHAHDDGARLAVAVYDGARGNPVLIDREHWPEALALAGDEGARVLLRRHGAREVPCDGTGDPTDVDTPDALAAVEARLAQRRLRES